MPIPKTLKPALHHEAAPGVLLVTAMAAALLVANSGASWYGAILETPAVVGIGDWGIILSAVVGGLVLLQVSRRDVAAGQPVSSAK